MKPVELTDLLTYRFLSEPAFSPDGRRAAFVVSEADEEENTYESRLWLYEEGRTRPLTGLGKERGFHWLDENRLLFPAVRSAAEKKRAEKKEPFTSYYVLDLRGGEAQPLFTLPFAARRLWVLDETHFAVSAGVDKACPDLYMASEEERAAWLRRREEEKDYEVLDELPFWFNGAGVVNGERTALFLVSLAPFQVTPVLTAPDDLDAVTVKGDEVFYAYERVETRRPLKGFSLDAVNWRTGEKRRVFRTEDLTLGGLEAAGDRLLLLATTGERHGLNENDWVYTLDPADGTLRVLREEEYSLYNSVGSDVRYGGGRTEKAVDGSLYHLTTRGGSAHLYRLDPDGSDTPVYDADGAIDAFDIAGDTVLAVGLYDLRPQELYTIDLKTGARTRVTDLNGPAVADRYIAEPRPLTALSEGRTVEGWVLLPKDYDPDKRYPAVFDIHGGPKTVYGPVFYHEMQVWASLGYFVFFSNPKGSDGGPNAFMDIRGDYGGADYRDLMAFADAVLAAYPAIDPARVCETGGSYGGFMTNWIIGHTDRFCCAASQRSISNWLSFWGVSDIGFYFAPDQTGGDIRENAEKLWAQSPLKYAKNAVTPTLFIHSDEDYRCPLEQGLQMYTALAERGVPARLCLFHGENHELSRSGKPKHRLRRLREITDWFGKYART